MYVLLLGVLQVLNEETRRARECESLVHCVYAYGVTICVDVMILRCWSKGSVVVWGTI